jgi:molybdopterin converting factor small subunit
MGEFKEIVGGLMERDSATNMPKITQIIDKYLGKGKKISEATRDQAELVYLIVNEIKEDLI